MTNEVDCSIVQYYSVCCDTLNCSICMPLNINLSICIQEQVNLHSAKVFGKLHPIYGSRGSFVVVILLKYTEITLQILRSISAFLCVNN